LFTSFHRFFFINNHLQTSKRMGTQYKPTSGAIPITRDKNDGWIPNPRDLSTTPGGTMYATTPGGTKIAYNRDALLLLSRSPLAKTPPKLPVIPGVTVDITSNPKGKPKQPTKTDVAEDSELFHMELK